MGFSGDLDTYSRSIGGGISVIAAKASHAGGMHDVNAWRNKHTTTTTLTFSDPYFARLLPANTRSVDGHLAGVAVEPFLALEDARIVTFAHGPKATNTNSPFFDNNDLTPLPADTRSINGHLAGVAIEPFLALEDARIVTFAHGPKATNANSPFLDDNDFTRGRNCDEGRREKRDGEGNGDFRERMHFADSKWL